MPLTVSGLAAALLPLFAYDLRGQALTLHDVQVCMSTDCGSVMSANSMVDAIHVYLVYSMQVRLGTL